MSADVSASGRRRKDERVYVRVSEDVKRVLERAAEMTGRSLSDFVVNSAFDAAQKAIAEVERMHLAAEDRAVFLAALSSPPAPSEALRAAAARHRKLIG